MPPRAPWQRRGEDHADSSGGEALVSQSGRHSGSPMKAHVVATVSEFIGTFLFLFFALGGTHVVNTAVSPDWAASTNQNPAKLLYISLCFGISLAVNVWAFCRIEGGMFNPAVAIAMFATGGINIIRLALIVIAQLAGSIAASGLVVGLLPGGTIAAATTLGGGISVVQGFFLELFLTAELVFVIFMLAIEKNTATPVAPVGIGLALFIAELVGVYYTGGSLNPARSFGPAVVTGGFPHYHWIYWLGPILGGLLAAGFYKLIKTLGFHLVTPDVDVSPSKQQEAHASPATSGEV
ncbi:aquaporin [Cryphonectria parasitica EP155]|uniref:Aquaporin n=1 Tax=Cryphonectria parasitica (strain ATCC 38755 / EP155) TaxID=660469 RepID=A0A9P4Y4U3_CRYP1|nr:aquaporin [Cryphonectria parasitica EP155]KAF3766974.1 aquaporin [Cryphonectria parasitica EP155]